MRHTIYQAKTKEHPKIAMSEEQPPKETPEVISTGAKNGVRLTQRDMHLLKWIGEQNIVRYDTVQEILAQERNPERPAHLHKAKKATNKLSRSNTERILARWKELKLIDTRKPYYDEPLYIWLSQHGLWELGLEYKSRPPSLVMLKHFHEVNNVRLWVETQAKVKDGKLHLHEWRSERWLRHQWGAINAKNDKERNRPDHTPDGLIIGEIYTGKKWEQATIAIEVELTGKKEQRLKDIIAWLDSQDTHTSIWYFVNNDTRNQVIRNVKNYDAFTVYDIHTFQRLHPL